MPTLADGINKFFAESPNPVFFAGAGVLAREGLPTWGSCVNSLAEDAMAEDPLTAMLMLECARDEDYLKAASYSYLTSKVRQVDSCWLLTQPLGNASELSALEVPISPVDIQMRFAAFVDQMRATEVQLEAASFKADATIKAMLARTFSENRKNDSLEIRDVAAVA